jgi:hypothetical protein
LVKGSLRTASSLYQLLVVHFGRPCPDTILWSH